MRGDTLHVTESGSTAFLQQAHRNNWQQYLVSLRPDAPGGWDLCVLTASDERQAAMYRRQLALRREAGLLPLRTRFLVVADPAGQRIGSGGATLRVLTLLASSAVDSGLSGCSSARLSDLQPPAENDVLTAGRVLVIHSGGDSRRLPHCSATGKLFARIPRALPDGRASTIFDEFLISLSGLAVEMPPGVLVASGDVLLVFDHLQPGFQRPGVIGVAAAAPAEMGTRHGVYVSGRMHNIGAYLHKPSLELMQKWEAIAGDGTVAIDTGLIWLDAQTVQTLVALAREETVAAFCSPPAAAGGQEVSPRQRQPLAGLNLYGDLMMPLAESTTLAGYLADTSDGPDTPAVRAARQVIWEHLRGIPFTMERLQPAIFLHIGTSQEYWTLVANSPELARTCGWSPHTASWALELIRAGSDYSDTFTLINAVVRQDATGASDPGLVVDSQVDGPLMLQGAVLLAGLCTGRPLTLGADMVVHQLPVAGDRFVTRVFGLHDDAKRPWDDPGATFMNHPWRAWLDRAGVDPETIWPGSPIAVRTLWNARLYPVVAEREDSLALSLPLQDPASAPPSWRARWESSPRLSLAESFAQADGERILAELAAIEDEVAARSFCSAIAAERPATEAKTLLGPEHVVSRRAERCAGWLANDDSILRLRGYKALAEATGEMQWEDRAFATLATIIGEAVSRQQSGIARSRTGSRRLVSDLASDNRAVRVEAAARIDFGGGWTDTPPYSIERGGTVLNAAVTLHDRYPIVAQAEWLPEPRLVLDSRDIGATLEPSLVGKVLAYANPADPFALLKAALVLQGIIPANEDPGKPLAEVLPDSDEHPPWIRPGNVVHHGRSGADCAGPVAGCRAYTSPVV